MNVCLIKLGALTMGAYKLIIVVSTLCIGLFISAKWLSLSLLTNVGLKYTLSDISIATPTSYQLPLAW
jgi:hypothetical protein